MAGNMTETESLRSAGETGLFPVPKPNQLFKKIIPLINKNKANKPIETP
jgi:hypothetical protein